MKIKYLFLIFFILLLPITASAQNNNVLTVEINDTIDQSTVMKIEESIQEANRINSSAIILLLDTPGGGVQETFDIWELIRKSKIPFVGYVYPPGAASWSAGTFIIIGTHVAVMANNTIIGSAQPVEITVDGTRYINDSKTINALVARLRERADLYARNKSIVGEFITNNVNFNEKEALNYEVIEFISNSIEELLMDINGSVVNTSFGKIELNTSGAKIINYSPSFKIQLIKVISNPVLTSLLLILGLFSVIFGISSPGFGAEVFGIIAILLSLIGSGFSIPILSIIFLIIGCLLLIVEIFITPGFGIIGIGGVICLIIGSVFLIPSYPNREWLITSDYMVDVLLIILSVIIVIAIFFAFLLYKVIIIRRKKAQVGIFIGETAKTVDRITPDSPGYVRYKGELWHAKSDTVIEENKKVEIINKDQSTLIVKPKQ